MLVVLLILVGIVGVVVPVLPGLLLVWGAVVVWAVAAEGNDTARWVVGGVATAIAAPAVIVSAILPARRAAAAGAPRSLMWIVALGTAVGFFVVPVVGALIGGPVAAYVAELLRLRDPASAWRSAVETLKGFGIGVAIQLAAAVAVAVVWAVVVVV